MPRTPPPPPAPSDADDLARRARRGAALALAGYGAGRALGLVSSPLLSYLLPPEARGLMEWVNPLLLGVELVTDIGLGPAIVQGARGDDPAFLDVAWTIQAARGALVWLAVSALALPYAALAGAPALVHLVPVAGLSALVGGLASTRIHARSRDLALGRLTAIELVAQVFGFAAKLAAAWWTPTAWALVLGGLSTAALRSVLSHVALPGPRHRVFWDRRVARELLRVGRWVFVSTLLTFLAGAADRWLVGAMVPVATLGLYGNAAALAALPVEALSQLAQRVVFPLYARVVRSGAPLGPAFRRARLPVQLVGGWSLAGLAAGGPTAVRWLYDPRWWGSGWMIPILAASSWFLVCEATHGAALLARGDARSVAAGALAKVAGMAVLVPVGAALGGFPGALVALAAAEPLRYAVSVGAVARIGLSEWRVDLALTVAVALTASIGALVGLGLRARGVAPGLEAFGVALAVSVPWALVAWAARRARALGAEAGALGLVPAGSVR